VAQDGELPLDEGGREEAAGDGVLPAVVLEDGGAAVAVDDGHDGREKAALVPKDAAL